MGKVDVRHAAASELVADLEFADLAAGRGNHFRSTAGRPRPPPPGLTAKLTKKLCSRTAFMSISAGSSTGLRSNTLPVSAGRPPSDATIPAFLFRTKELCDSQGCAGPVIR